MINIGNYEPNSNKNGKSTNRHRLVINMVWFVSNWHIVAKQFNGSYRRRMESVVKYGFNILCVILTMNKNRSDAMNTANPIHTTRFVRDDIGWKHLLKLSLIDANILISLR